MLNRGMSLGLWAPGIGLDIPPPAFEVAPTLWINADDVPGSGRYLPNHADPVVAAPGNLMVLSSGQLTCADVGCTFTDRNATGPGGQQTAVRFAFGSGTGAGEFFNRTLPAGTYTYSMQVKSVAGQGTFNVSHGAASRTITEVNESTWTTCSGTMVSNGSSNVRFMLQNDAGVAKSVLVDELQLYAPGESMPAFSTEINHSYAGYALKLSDTFAKTGNAIAASGTTGGQLLLDSFPLTTSISEGTLMAVVKTSNTAQTTRKVLGFGVGQGTFNLAITTGQAYSKPAVALTNSIYRIAGKGYHIIAGRFKAGEQSFFMDGVQMTTTTDTLSTITSACMGFLTDQHPNTQNSFQAGGASGFTGEVTQAIFWDTWLDDDQVREATLVARAAHVSTGEADVVTENFWIVEGDSISAETYQVIYFNDNPTTYMGINMAVIGATMTGGNSLTARQPRLLKCIEASNAMGYNTIVSVLIGANGLPTITQLTDYYDVARAAGAKVIACTITPKSDATFNTNRNALNTQIRAASSHYDALCDFAADPVMGPDSAGSDTSLYGDGTHPTNPLGRTNLKEIMAPVLATLAV